MLLGLAYLGVTNAFAMLRLLPMSDRDECAEILALRLWVPGIMSPGPTCWFDLRKRLPF